MKKTTMVLAAFAAVLFPATAFAGLDFANSFQTGPGSLNATVTVNGSGGTYDPAGTVGVTATGSPSIAVIDVLWNSPVSAAPPTASPDLILYFGSVSSGLVLSAVGVSEDGTNFVTENLTNPISTSYANGEYRFNFSSVSAAQRDAIVAARLQFSLGSGASFTLDGVSTPEPGTFALFGLGLLGLGGAVVRRRRKAKAA